MRTNQDLDDTQLEQIRQRAYLRFEARGKEEGHALEDWLAAEDEVLHADGDDLERDTPRSSKPRG